MSDRDSTAPVEYRAIEGYPGYQVGDDGSVLGDSPRKLAPFVDSSNGYCRIDLYKSGTRHRVYVHNLVLTAFVGPRPEGMEACHNNGIQTDNRSANLRWGSRKSNVADMVLHGTRRVNENFAKLTEEEVRLIRNRLKAGEKARDIAKDFGVHKTSIERIKSGHTWRMPQGAP